MSFSSSDRSGGVTVASWLPDETLFSLASRHHLVSCNYLASETSRQLFGHPRSRSRPDFPSGIDFFVDATDGRFGAAVDVIFRHTLLPFYLPFNTRLHASQAISSLRGDRIGSLRFSLGMLLNHFHGRHPLKACDQCVKEDTEKFCVAYWHRIHQVPGVWVCPHHQNILEVLSGTDARAGYNWCLPRSEGSTRLASPLQIQDVVDQLGCFSKLSCAALRITALAPHVFLDGERLVRAYTTQLRSMGLQRKGGKLRFSDCITSMLKSASTLRVIPELAALPATERDAHMYVSQICRRPVVRMHPLQHLFAIVWLFKDWEDFWTAYTMNFR
ncbi:MULTISPECIES: TnsD family Tn7-like transposition protein [Paraburkholderia]|uniref:TnsD family Tn7-like transposition protein n=1 Tax=Paraburkholderia TaxID=1822464 RepID=UPI002256B769|nr:MULTISPECIES: TnsD family Tn7-like transposition protein [Paraburkholderia]MCX4162771.1 TniQ family protein [Paraburkholderia megapolitana]MDN7158266.1 TnsD family transposase [Paraburkholderia sp. CHISQ3]MDQ6495313.1 TnsD family transposase [Paraburkholderia megapolitana]